MRCVSRLPRCLFTGSTPAPRLVNCDLMAVAATPDDSGLPGWLDELLKPGVSPGVFTTLKLSLVSLIIVLSSMLCIIQDSVRV